MAYNRDGAPVSKATAIDLGGWSYIAAVATHAAHRQKGYGRRLTWIFGRWRRTKPWMPWPCAGTAPVDAQTAA